MTKQIICFSFVILLISCKKNTSEIKSWNYSEELRKEEVTQLTDIKELKQKYEVLFTV